MSHNSNLVFTDYITINDNGPGIPTTTLTYCKNKPSLLTYLEQSETQNIEPLYLVDYEFIGENYTGKDLILLLMSHGISTQDIYLVTSHSSEAAIQKFCTQQGLHHRS